MQNANLGMQIRMPRPAKNIKNKLARKSFYRMEIERKLRKQHIFLLMALKKANILQHTFSSDTPQSIKRQNKGPKEHDENIYPVVDRNRPIRKTQAQDRYS